MNVDEYRQQRAKAKAESRRAAVNLTFERKLQILEELHKAANVLKQIH